MSWDALQREALREMGYVLLQGVAAPEAAAGAAVPIGQVGVPAAETEASRATCLWLAQALRVPAEVVEAAIVHAGQVLPPREALRTAAAKRALWPLLRPLLRKP